MICTFTLVLPPVGVQCPVWLTLQLLNFVLPGMLLGYCASDFKMVPVAPVITGILLLTHSTCAEFLL